MIDVAADAGYLTTTLTIMNMLQCIKQARWLDENTLLTLPRIRPSMLPEIQFKASWRENFMLILLNVLTLFV